MTIPRVSWGTAGILAGLVGLVVSHAATMLLTPLRSSPFVAVTDLVIRYTPGPVADWVIDVVGALDKPILILIVTLVMLTFMLAAGRLAEGSWWAPIVVFLAMGAVGAWAVLVRSDDRPVDLVPVVAGTVTWIVVLSLLTEPLHREALVERERGLPFGDDPVLDRATRRTVLVRTGLVGVAAAAVGVTGEVLGRGRRHVERSRRLLNLPITDPAPPAGVRLAGEGLSRWQTRTRDFYQIDTTVLGPPAIEPTDWRLRIHGMVDREMVLTFQDLLDRRITEGWITLNCVSNPVGGPLIGNAWWSGVRVATLLEEVGVHPDADAVLQRSHDDWTCGTPLSALTDDRNAMIAVGMNGEPLPLEHGFPARMIVPGLYGYVSACKWLVDIEVTRFADIEAFWVGKGWSEEAPVKMSSRIDVPGDGEDVPVGPIRVGGVAWAQHTGIAAVEYALDGGPWRPAEIGGVAHFRDGNPNDDTWVQWAATIEVDEGDHELRVRATDKDGLVQTGAETDVRPDGATGWHAVAFSAE